MSSETYEQSKSKMEKTVSVLKEDLQTIRTGRANPNMLDKVVVDYYGSKTPIKQIASVSAPEPRTIQVQPWDKSALKDIEKAIQIADLGFNPTNDGNIIRIAVPQLTEERRKDLIKQANKMGEEAKIALRNVRREANDIIKKFEKDGDISEDDAKKELENIQKLIDNMEKEIDEVLSKKEADIKEI